MREKLSHLIMKHLDIKIYGRVQGVFYRVSCRKEAQRLGITGYVRNADDKTVEITAEGNEKNLDEFIKWCKKGPLVARVEKIECRESGGIIGYEKFEIKR